MVQVEFLGSIYTANNTSELNEIIQSLNQKANENGLVVSQYNVDGEVYYNLLDNVLLNTETIKIINITVITIKELMLNMFKEGYDYLKRALPEIDKLISSFYYEEKNENWLLFQEFIDGLQWIIKLTEHSQEIVFVYSNQLKEVHHELKEKLSELLYSIEIKDITLMADIMTYEIVPALTKLKETLGSIVLSNISDNH